MSDKQSESEIEYREAEAQYKQSGSAEDQTAMLQAFYKWHKETTDNRTDAR